MNDAQHNMFYIYAECHVLFTIMLNVIMLRVVMLNVIILSVIMPSRVS